MDEDGLEGKKRGGGGTETDTRYQTTSNSNRVYCLFGLCAGCGTPPPYFAHAFGTHTPAKKNNKKAKILPISEIILPGFLAEEI